MDRKVIYTALFGDKDSLIEPEYIDDKVDYICFTDSKEVNSKLFKCVYIEPIFIDPRLSARIFKLLPHAFLSNYDESIWIDGKVLIKGDVFSLMGNKDDMMVTFKHPLRDCVYEELRETERLGKITKTEALSQEKYYLNNGMPNKFGLFETAVVYRKHMDENVIEIDEMWWNQIRNFTVRDQISLPFCSWKLDFKIRKVDLNVENNKFTQVKEHNY